MSASAKLRDLDGFALSLATFGFRNPLRLVLLFTVPIVELGLGLALLLDIQRSAAAILASLLLLAFTGLLVWAKVRGLSISCGCMGGAGRVAPVSLLAIARNAGFILLGLAALISNTPSALPVVLLSAGSSGLGNLLFAEYLTARDLIRRHA